MDIVFSQFLCRPNGLKFTQVHGEPEYIRGEPRKPLPSPHTTTPSRPPVNFFYTLPTNPDHNKNINAFIKFNFLQHHENIIAEEEVIWKFNIP